MRKIKYLMIWTIPMVIITFIGLIISNQYVRYQFSEVFTKEFTLAENVVFDESEVVDFYGDKLEFSVGSTGKIVEHISNREAIKGNHYINVHITADNSQIAEAAISTDSVEKKIIVYDSDYYGVAVVFEPKNIDSYQTIMDDYFLAVNRYESDVRLVHITTVVICFIVSIILSVCICMIYKKKNKITESILYFFKPIQ